MRTERPTRVDTRDGGDGLRQCKDIRICALTENSPFHPANVEIAKSATSATKWRMGKASDSTDSAIPDSFNISQISQDSSLPNPSTQSKENSHQESDIPPLPFSATENGFLWDRATQSSPQALPASEPTPSARSSYYKPPYP
jgi:hypothetical protein